MLLFPMTQGRLWNYKECFAFDNPSRNHKSYHCLTCAHSGRQNGSWFGSENIKYFLDQRHLERHQACPQIKCVKVHKYYLLIFIGIKLVVDGGILDPFELFPGISAIGAASSVLVDLGFGPCGICFLIEWRCALFGFLWALPCVS